MFLLKRRKPDNVREILSDFDLYSGTPAHGHPIYISTLFLGPLCSGPNRSSSSRFPI